MLTCIYNIKTSGPKQAVASGDEITRPTNAVVYLQRTSQRETQCRPKLKSIDKRTHFLRRTNTVFTENVDIKKTGVLEQFGVLDVKHVTLQAPTL